METETPTTPPETPPEPTEPAPAAPPEENLVGEAKRKQKAAERERDEFRERFEALEDAGKSEAEKVRVRAEKAEKESAEVRAENSLLKKGGWVRDAAVEANFHKPDRAAALVSLDEVDDADDAKRLVKALTKSDPYLVKPDNPDLPGRVLEGGKPPRDPARPRSDIDPEAEAEMVAGELKRFSGDTGWLSVGN